MGNTIYIILGVVVVIYLFISVTNRRQHKERKSRKFMEGYKRKESKEIEE
ncbi:MULTISPECIES: hypothetical protein [Bacteroidota]|uniref:Uncharacterized protein n=1 Tax=Euzebyella saccharophila TaxID=679664 RepID=A0ABV8JL56_9FLAO|nr:MULTISPECIES: hypothetical protein [Bacteroidota]MBC6998864.1 hypothetical protein [Cytophaga sp. FL35]